MGFRTIFSNSHQFWAWNRVTETKTDNDKTAKTKTQTATKTATKKTERKKKTHAARHTTSCTAHTTRCKLVVNVMPRKHGGGGGRSHLDIYIYIYMYINFEYLRAWCGLQACRRRFFYWENNIPGFFHCQFWKLSELSEFQYLWIWGPV